MHTVAACAGLAALELEADQHALKAGFAFDERFFTGEVVLLGFQWNRESDTCFEGIGLVAEFGTGLLPIDMPARL